MMACRQLGPKNNLTYCPTAVDHYIPPDLETYRRGYQDGIAEFCTLSIGFEEGRSGASYSSVCPAHLEPDFLDGYADGRAIFEAWAAVGEVESVIAIA